MNVRSERGAEVMPLFVVTTCLETCMLPVHSKVKGAYMPLTSGIPQLSYVAEGKGPLGYNASRSVDGGKVVARKWISSLI